MNTKIPPDDASCGQPFAQEQRQLVGAGRTRIRDAEDADHDPATGEGVDRRRSGLVGGLVVHVDRVLAEARHAARVPFRAERDDERVGGDRAAAHLRLARVGADRVDRAGDHIDATLAQCRERALAFGQRRGADETPVLAQPHHEALAALDEDDLVGRLEVRTERDGRGDATEPPAEHEHAMHGGYSARDDSQAEPLEITDRNDGRTLGESHLRRLELDSVRKAARSQRGDPAALAAGVGSAADADEVGRRIGEVEVRLVEDERRRVVDDRHVAALERLEQADHGARDRPPERAIEHEDRERRQPVERGLLA